MIETPMTETLMTETAMTETPTMSNGALIRTVRTMFGIRQRDLAKSVGISQQALSQIEHDITKNSPYVPLLKIKLGIPVAPVDPALLDQTLVAPVTTQRSAAAAEREAKEQERLDRDYPYFAAE